MTLEKLNKIITKAHNHMYANDGVSNSEALEELIKLMYCKIQLEKDDITLIGLDSIEIVNLTKGIYSNLTKKYPEIFRGKIKTNDTTISFIMELFSAITFTELHADKKGHILQKVMDRSYRERNGQFFTPSPVVDFIVKMIEPKAHEKGADPASGTGGFLFSALEFIFKNENKISLENMSFYEISEQISRLIRMRILFEFDNYNPNIYVGDSLKTDFNSSYDYILSNPPFGSQGKVTNKDILNKFELGFDSKKNKVYSSQVPDILFVEKIISSLKIGGRAAVVLPDGDLENPSTDYLREFIMNKTRLDAVVALPSGTFIPYGTGVKASILFFTKLSKENLLKEIANNYGVFFSQINKLGYTFSKHSKEDLNSNNELIEDYSKVLDSFKNKKYDAQSFIVPFKEIKTRNTFSYHYFNPNYNATINKIKSGPHLQLKDAVEFITAKTKIVADKEYNYIEIADIVSSISEITNFETMLGSDLPSRASYKVKENYLIVAIAGNAIGTSKHSKAIVTKEYENCICTNGFSVMKATRLSPYYLIYFFNSQYFLDQVKKYRYGSAIPTISREDMMNIYVPIYDDSVMKKIEEGIKKAYDLRKTAKTLMTLDYSSSSN